MTPVRAAVPETLTGLETIILASLTPPAVTEAFLYISLVTQVIL